MDARWILGGITAAAGIVGGAVIYKALTDETVTVSNPKISVTCLTPDNEYGKTVVEEARKLMKGAEVSPIVQYPTMADNGKVRYVRCGEGTVFFSTDPKNLDPAKFTPNVKVVDKIGNRTLYMQVPWSRFVLFVKYFNSLNNLVLFTVKKSAPPHQKKGSRR